MDDEDDFYDVPELTPSRLYADSGLYLSPINAELLAKLTAEIDEATRRTMDVVEKLFWDPPVGPFPMEMLKPLPFTAEIKVPGEFRYTGMEPGGFRYNYRPGQAPVEFVDDEPPKKWEHKLYTVPVGMFLPTRTVTFPDISEWSGIEVVGPQIDLSRYPHKCNSCGSPCYHGFGPADIDCSNVNCPTRKR